jgi:hypothetical protein
MSDFKNLRGVERREFLKWSLIVSSLMGVERARHLEVLSDLGGTALADSATASKLMKTIHICDGNGGLANWTLAFPNTYLATNFQANYAHFAPGVKGTKIEPGRELYYGPATAAVFNALPANFQVAAFLANTNQTHTAAPASMIGGGNALLASVSSIQSAINPVLVSTLLVGNPAQLGTATGAPAAAGVANAAGLVNLFSSQASQTLLRPAGNPELAQKYHAAFLALNSAARSGTAKRHFDASKVAMSLLGQNLGPALQPSAADLALFGIGAMTPPQVQNMSRAIITTLKAMSMGLANQIVMPGFNNDPHGLFAGGKAAATNVELSLANMLKGFHALADSLKDPASGLKLSERIMMTVHGDTMKQPFNEGGWPDGTPGNTNVLYVIGGSSRLKSGWSGGFSNPNTPMDFVAETGATVARGTAGSVAGAAAFASAASAVAYAVCADLRRPDDFGRNTFSGLVNASIL